MELCLAKILNALGWWLNFLWIAALKSNLNQYGGKNFFFSLFQSDVNESLVLVSCEAEGCRSFLFTSLFPSSALTAGLDQPKVSDHSSSSAYYALF